jgi:hypothetical protein
MSVRETLPRTVRVLALAVVLSVVMYAVVRWVFGLAIPYLLYLVAVLAILFGRWVVVAVRPPSTSDRPLREDTESRSYGALPDRPFLGVRRWEDMLELTRGDPEYFHRTVRPEILALLEERLRRTGEVAAPEEFLGAELAVLSSDSDRSKRAPSPRELAAIVTRLEELWTNRP